MTLHMGLSIELPEIVELPEGFKLKKDFHVVNIFRERKLHKGITEEVGLELGITDDPRPKPIRDYQYMSNKTKACYKEYLFKARYDFLLARKGEGALDIDTGVSLPDKLEFRYPPKGLQLVRTITQETIRPIMIGEYASCLRHIPKYASIHIMSTATKERYDVYLSTLEDDLNMLRGERAKASQAAANAPVVLD